MYLNKAIIMGNLTRDPELKALPSGVKVCTFAIATNRVWKNKDNVRQEAVDYHNVVVFNRQAETSAQYLKKGQTALVEGRMQTRSWDAQDGQKRYRTELVADRVQFGNRPVGTGGAGGGASGIAGGDGGDVGVGQALGGISDADGNMGSAGSDVGTGNVNKNNIPSDAIEYPAEEINPDDIPF